MVGRTVGCTVVPYTGRSLAMVPNGRCRIIGDVGLDKPKSNITELSATFCGGRRRLVRRWLAQLRDLPPPRDSPFEVVVEGDAAGLDVVAQCKQCREHEGAEECRTDVGRARRVGAAEPLRGRQLSGIAQAFQPNPSKPKRALTVEDGRRSRKAAGPSSQRPSLERGSTRTRMLDSGPRHLAAAARKLAREPRMKPLHSVDGTSAPHPSREALQRSRCLTG